MCACTSMAGFCFSGTNEGSFCFCINIIIEFHPNPEFYILLKMWSDLSYRKEENVNLPKFSLGTWHGKNKQYQGYMSAPLLWMPLLSVCCKPQPHSCCMRSSWPQLPSKQWGDMGPCEERSWCCIPGIHEPKESCGSWWGEPTSATTPRCRCQSSCNQSNAGTDTKKPPWLHICVPDPFAVSLTHPSGVLSTGCPSLPRRPWSSCSHQGAPGAGCASLHQHGAAVHTQPSVSSLSPLPQVNLPAQGTAQWGMHSENTCLLWKLLQLSCSAQALSTAHEKHLHSIITPWWRIGIRCQNTSHGCLFNSTVNLQCFIFPDSYLLYWECLRNLLFTAGKK